MSRTPLNSGRSSTCLSVELRKSYVPPPGIVDVYVNASRFGRGKSPTLLTYTGVENNGKIIRVLLMKRSVPCFRGGRDRRSRVGSGRISARRDLNPRTDGRGHRQTTAVSNGRDR